MAESKERVIKDRVDEYLAACKQGRHNYAAGNIRRAKDLFNLALGLELVTELDSHFDSGITSGLLRDELNSRHPGLVELSNQTVRFENILAKLEHVYEMADKKAARKPSDAESYLTMGSALCAVNEWEKAKEVYMEGIRACANNKDIVNALQRLNNLQEMLQNKATDNNLSLSPKLTRKRPKSQIDVSETDGVSRSTSFVDDGFEIRYKPTLPRSKTVSKIGFNFGSLSPTKIRKSIPLHFFKRQKSNLVGIIPSWSSEDVSRLYTEWSVRSTWKNMFSPTIHVSLHSVHSYTSKLMRLMSHAGQSD